MPMQTNKFPVSPKRQTLRCLKIWVPRSTQQKMDHFPTKHTTIRELRANLEFTSTPYNPSVAILDDTNDIDGIETCHHQVKIQIYKCLLIMVVTYLRSTSE